MKNFLGILLAILVSAGCSLLPKKKTSFWIDSTSTCESIVSHINSSGIEMKLNYLIRLYKNSCNIELIKIAAEIRNQNRDKYYSIVKEAAEVVLYEGYAKDYVLESYERTYLSILMALAYRNLKDFSGMEIELNRAYNESVAQIYNSGEDEITVFLQGLLWLDLFGPEKALPFFKKIEGNPLWHSHLKLYASQIYKNAASNQKVKISIYVVHQMPEIHFSRIGHAYEVFKPSPKLKDCISPNGILLTTSNWVNQIKDRDNSKKDGLLNYKRAARIPISSIYAGAVLVGGVALYSLAPSSGMSHYILAAALLGSYTTFWDGMAPDIRYWSELPQAFYFTTETMPTSDPCLRRVKTSEYPPTLLFSI